MIANTQKPKILTNMAFWQSSVWTRQVESIYPMKDRNGDPKFWSPCKEAFQLFLRRRGFDVVVTMGDRTSLWYGLLCALFLQPSKQILTEIFIDPPQPSFGWKLKTWLFGRIARRSLGILTNSSTEIKTIGERFRLPMNKLRYVPLHSTIHEPELVETNEDFILAAGRTLRDYNTLIQASLLIRKPVHIVAGQKDLLSITYPSNVTVHRELSRAEYLDLLRRCKIVVLPLLPTERATGQVVVLEAMALGKPVIATRAPGTIDLIRHDETGLLVEPRDPEAIIEAVQTLLDNPPLAKKMAQEALDDVKKKHTFDIHAEKKLETINLLWMAEQA